MPLQRTDHTGSKADATDPVFAHCACAAEAQSAIAAMIRNA
jgi:hypothetical protein